MISVHAHLRRLLAAEYERFAKLHPASAAAHHLAYRRLPLGVGSSFQFFEPFPVSIHHAEGPFAWDADGSRFLDLNMGFGALLVGHRHPQVMDAVQRQLTLGTLYVAPNNLAEEVAALLSARFGHPLWRFMSSGTEATMTAVRLARAHTNRPLLVKVEGGYHGHGDTVLVSGKPSPEHWGPTVTPHAIPDSLGIPEGIVESTIVVPFNDIDALEAVLETHGDRVAGFIIEPVLENAGIVMPAPGYLQQVRAACDRHGVVLIFDEVKTGLTASYAGAAGLFNVRPDLSCFAKSIGGGLPIAALGGREDVMRTIEHGCVHHGTFNANPLVLAAAKATLEVCTAEALALTHRVNEHFAEQVRTLLAPIADVVPTQVQTVGSKGSITFAADIPRNYRDWKLSSFLAAELFWLWSTNRGVLTPPGLDEQWLVSLAHTPSAMEVYLTQLADITALIAALG